MLADIAFPFSLPTKERAMLRTALLALPLVLLTANSADAAAADSFRTGKVMKRACLSKAAIAAQLKRRGLRPVEKLRRRRNTYSVLAERGRGARKTGARVVVNACTGKILRVSKAVLPARLKLKTICKTKAEIVTKFDALGYYHIQVEGPFKLTPPPAGYTGLAYSVRAWTKAPPKCPWNFAVKCSDGTILTQSPDAC